jgi:hypothetical protein
MFRYLCVNVLGCDWVSRKWRLPFEESEIFDFWAFIVFGYDGQGWSQSQATGQTMRQGFCRKVYASAEITYA